MKISTDENGILVFEEIYNSILIKPDSTPIALCMRDGGIEFGFCENDEIKQWWFAKDGVVAELKGLANLKVVKDPDNA